MEDPNVTHQAHVNSDGHVLTLHHLLNSVEQVSPLNNDEAQRQAIEKQLAQDQGVIELHQIAEQKSNGEPSIQQLEEFTEPPKKKPRKGGRKKKSEAEGTVIIDGQTIIATGEQVGDASMVQTPKKACLMCGAPIALRNYCWKCYKRKQRSASKMEPQSDLVAMAAMVNSIPEQSVNLNLMGSPIGANTPPIVTSPGSGMGISPLSDPNMISKRGRRHKPVTDLADVDRKLRRVQEKVTEEMEKWVGSKDEAQQLIDEWAKKRVKQINRSFSTGVNNNLNNMSNSNSNASGDETVEPLPVVTPAEPETYQKIGRAYCEFVRNLPVNSPFRKPLLASILKHSNEELSIHEFERAVPVTHTTLMQCKKMSDEENLFVVIKTLPSQIKDRLKKSPRDDGGDGSVATMMEEAVRLEEHNSNENSLNSVASAAESATAEQLLQMVPPGLSQELAQLQSLQHYQNSSNLHSLVHEMNSGNIVLSANIVNGSPQH